MPVNRVWQSSLLLLIVAGLPDLARAQAQTEASNIVKQPVKPLIFLEKTSLVLDKF